MVDVEGRERLLSSERKIREVMRHAWVRLPTDHGRRTSSEHPPAATTGLLLAPSIRSSASVAMKDGE